MHLRTSMPRVREAAFNGSRAEEFDAEDDERASSQSITKPGRYVDVKAGRGHAIPQRIDGFLFTAFENVFGQ